MTYVAGGPPQTEADWRRVADTLRQLHRSTQRWPQRPGWRSSTDLLHAETGTKIDLGAMPPEGVARCRAAWARLIGRNLRRLTSIAEDLPVASRSPDGSAVAFLGGGSARTAETGLVVVAAEGSGLRRLTSRPGHRGADWHTSL
jgi:hypothetical protein